MAQSALPYPSNPSLEQLKVLATDSVIYLAPSGSDGTGDGSLAKPYLTLHKCMDVARTYTIVGSATLYIRFLRGEYTITQNVDLYHPQGGNLIIEGDPAEFKQRYLWQVENYTWNIDSFAGGGHTGSIRLFDGVTATVGGVTMHGFTGQDQGMYFTITNAVLDTPMYGYADTKPSNPSGGAANGINTTNYRESAYSVGYAGDNFFNHGVSYEDSLAVLGIGRIIGATTSTAVLQVQFQNPNIDSRCPGLTWGGGNAGVNNTISWGGIPSNYPEPQYSQPNGYYGPTNAQQASPYPWISAVQTAVKYPVNPGVSHNTLDAYLLSTYPVVIRISAGFSVTGGGSPYTTGVLFLKNGTLKALRNLFFASNAEPFVGTNGTTGSVLNTSQGLISAFASSDTGTGIYFENAKVAIRHLGFYGMHTAVSGHNSIITAYWDKMGGTGTMHNGVAFAVQNTLDNSPVICTTQVTRGIVAKNCTIDFTSGAALNNELLFDSRQSGCYISSTGRGVELTGTQFRAHSLQYSGAGDAPQFLARLWIPVFFGMTAGSGATAHAIAYNGSNYWKTFPVAKLFMHPAGGSEAEIGYCYSVLNAGEVSSGTLLTGSTAGTAQLIAPNTVHATSYQYINLFGIKTAPHGLSYMTTSDITQGITTGSGGTFGVRFYKDMTLSGVSASITIGFDSVSVQGANGVTIGYFNMPNGPSNTGNAASYFNSLLAWGFDYHIVWGNYGNGAVRIRDGSSMHIEKSLVIYNGGYSPVDVRRNSSLIVGSTRALAGNPSLATSVYDIVEGVPMVGNLSITGFGGKALRVSENSTATVGAMFVKHPLQNDPSVGAIVGKSPTPLVLVDKASSASFGRIYAVTHPAGKLLENPTGTGVGLWTTLSGVKWGSHYQGAAATLVAESMMRAESGSRIFLSRAGSMFAFDGGTAEMKVGGITPNAYVFASVGGSVVVSEGSEAYNSVSDAVPGACRTISDTRTPTTAQKIMTRSPSTASERYLYGAPSIRTWLGDQSGSNHNYVASHTNLSASGSIGVPGNPNPGGTMSVYISKNGTASN
jgi:hypothetical protein